MVIWITGISGAGKTTVCQAVSALCKPQIPQLVVIDGDIMRDVMGNDLSYREKDRFIQITRIQKLAKALAEQDLVVLVGALYARPDLLTWNRANLPGYFEVYISATLDLVRSRDPKGLYAKVDAGEISDVVGIDVPWHAPCEPDMLVDATCGEPADSVARKIASQVLGIENMN